MTLFAPDLDSRLHPILREVATRRDATINAFSEDGFYVYSKSEPDARSRLIHLVHMRRDRDNAHATVQVIPVAHHEDYLVQVLLSFPVTTPSP